ncbi:MAG: PaaI family thioesterase [Gemmatimonadetes bacterium]|nr:PaaI family thioesterase [Gemmatimonadota bacterium]
MPPTAPHAIQDFYPDGFATCYGCGRLNAHGLHVRTLLDGELGIAEFTPRAEHTGVAGFVYGGLLASLIDCHAIGTAAAIAEQAEGRAIGDAPAPRYVTASLQVDFVKPTPHGPPLALRARVVETTARKSIVEVSITADDLETVRGRVVAVRIPASMGGG